MRILVTGASGFVGHAVVSVLADRGHSVVALSRRGAAVPAKADHHIQADIRSRPDVVDAVAGVDAVCHLAALVRVRDSLSNPLEYWNTNVGGTLNVLHALAQSVTQDSPKRLVLSSTGAVYGSPEHDRPINEDHSTAPRNPYAATKLAADMAAAHLAATGVIGAVTLRAFNIAGASAGHTDRDLTRLIPKILAVRAGHADELVINGDGSAVRDFVHVDDMADAFAKAVEVCGPGTTRVYNIGSGRRTTIREVVTVAEDVTGKPVPVRHAPPADEPQLLVAEASRAQAELGWSPTRSDLTQIISDAWLTMKPS